MQWFIQTQEKCQPHFWTSRAICKKPYSHPPVQVKEVDLRDYIELQYMFYFDSTKSFQLKELMEVVSNQFKILVLEAALC
jgi:hypothetical protein